MFARLLAHMHALSLVAVAVLVVGQWAVSRWAGVDVPATAALGLGLAIWLGYTADRWSDLRASPELAELTLRHSLHDRYRLPLLGTWLVGLVLGMGVAVATLPARAVVSGLVLALLAGLYVALAPHLSGGGATGGMRLPLSGTAGTAKASWLKPLLATALLTAAVAWWPLAGASAGDALQWRAGGLALALAALGIAGNLFLLHLARRPRSGDHPPADRQHPVDRLGMASDGFLLLAFWALGLAAST